jgi:hypothetical protein
VIRAVPRPADAITLERGPLVFSLAVPEKWTTIGGEEPHATYEVHPTAPWNYAIEQADIRLIRRPATEHPVTRSTRSRR